ncbi:MAG TPA: VOC family protein, partial [Mycobacterium sp.]|nr:VOC family protein [Mycobacterium sp.]
MGVSRIGVASSTKLARRFLHVNLNTADTDRAQEFYAQCLGLTLGMHTDPGVSVDGTILATSGDVACDTRFLYDSRWPRTSCGIELIQWLDPATAPSTGSAAAGDTPVGLSRLAFRVADRAQTVADIAGRGFDVLDRATIGVITDGPAALIRDADGVLVEIGDLLPTGPQHRVHLDGVAVSCSDLYTSVSFYSQIGFVPVSGPERVGVIRLVLPEDNDVMRLCLTQHPTSETDSSREPNQPGLYRCALRVEDINAAIAATPDGTEVRGPVRCPLPG